MKKHRFLLRKNLEAQDISSEDKELVNQLSNVLRLKVGARIFLFDGSGNEILAEISFLNRQKAVFRRIETLSKGGNEMRKVTLYCAILKKENFEIVVQKATEIGVETIVPIVTDRTVKFGLKEERLIKIIKEASEQSGRIIETKMETPLKFTEAIDKARQDNDLNIVFDQSGERVGKLKSDKVGIFVGPEGGWANDELAFARKAGFVIGLLGRLTLRAETAAIIASFEAVNNF